MASDSVLLRAGGRSVLVEGGRISEVDPEQVPAGVLLLEGGEGSELGPGRVNAHTHIYSGLAPFSMPPPEPPPESFVQILERVWWRLDRALDASALRTSARIYVAEALLSGTSSLIDHHESPELIEGSLDILADVCRELGVRALLCYGATERNGGRVEGERGLAECRRFVRENRRPLVRGAVGLHASFTVSDGLLEATGATCGELGAICHVHLAEDGADVEDARQRGYAGPLERLLTRGALPAGSILAHGVFLDAAQVRHAAKQGLWLVQNPRSNAGNKVGYPAALGESDRVALGTDGYPADMLAERAALAELAAAHGDATYSPRVDAGRRLMSQLFDGSFELAPGAVADVGVFDGPRALHLVVGGRVVVRDGRLVSGDIDAIRDEAREQAERLWQRMDAV
ncbi:MAG: amidohydrolase family protein [Myxococcales bacterium]|nr:amidohydrolase family protein [Myxococcales bacterium]